MPFSGQRIAPGQLLQKQARPVPDFEDISLCWKTGEHLSDIG